MVSRLWLYKFRDIPFIIRQKTACPLPVAPRTANLYDDGRSRAVIGGVGTWWWGEWLGTGGNVDSANDWPSSLVAAGPGSLLWPGNSRYLEVLRVDFRCKCVSISLEISLCIFTNLCLTHARELWLVLMTRRLSGEHHHQRMTADIETNADPRHHSLTRI